MANNNIDQRISYRKGSSKPEQPRHEKLNGNVFSIFPIPHERLWYEDKPQSEDNGDNGDKGVKRPVPPEPYGEDTFGWQEYENYLDKLGPKAIPIPFNKFMDQLDMSPSDYWGKALQKEEGLLSLITPSQREELRGMIGAFIRANRGRA